MEEQLGEIARHALTGPLDGYEIVVSRSAMRYFPGGSTPIHRHPGIVLAYVLEGRVRFALNDAPEIVVPAEGTFFEPLGAMHTTSGSTSADEKTRVLVFEVRPKEQPPRWETLVQQPLPEGVEPVISVNGLTMPAQVAEHSHESPVIGYIASGEIENQVEPNPPAIYKPGGVFYEPPRQVHKMMRSLSAEPAKLLIFHAGRTGVPAPSLKPLGSEPTQLSFTEMTQWQVPLPSTVGLEMRLLRLTLPLGTRVEARAHTGPGMIYVLDGVVTLFGSSARSQTYWAGDLVTDPNTPGLMFSNASMTAPAALLLYHVTKRE